MTKGRQRREQGSGLNDNEGRRTKDGGGKDDGRGTKTITITKNDNEW